MNYWPFIFLALFLTLTITFWTTNVYKSEKFMKYFNILSIFSTMAFIVSFMLSVQQNDKAAQRRVKDEDDRKAAEFTVETEKNWIDLEKLFNDNYPYLSGLYKELYSDNLNLITPVLTNDQKIEASVKQQHVCNILFQIIENILSTNKDLGGLGWGWEKIFQSWSKSPTFQSNWNYSKAFYNPITEAYINKLIAIA